VGWGGPRQKGELRFTGVRLALRLSALASALAQEKGEALVVGWRETDQRRWNELVETNYCTAGEGDSASACLFSLCINRHAWFSPTITQHSAGIRYLPLRVRFAFGLKRESVVHQRAWMLVHDGTGTTCVRHGYTADSR
jgi:hypothetical protein